MHPYIVKVVSSSLKTQLPCATREQVEQVVAQQLEQLQEPVTLELWEWVSDGHYQLCQGWDKLYQPTIQHWDADMLPGRGDELRWDGNPETHPYLPETF